MTVSTRPKRRRGPGAGLHRGTSRPRSRESTTGRSLIGSLIALAGIGSITLFSAAFLLHNRASVRMVREARQDAASAKAALQETQQQMKDMKTKYETYVANLLGKQRAAEVVVEEQTRDDDGQVWTKLKFLEYSVDGQPLEPVKVFTLPGDVVYFDALVMKFAAENVQEGKAKSLYLFRRVFTDETRPDMGYKLFDVDASAGLPKNYQADAAEIPLQAQHEVWARFQKCMADPEHAAAEGVDTIYGEAVYDTLRKNFLYTLSIQNNGGLELKKRPLAAILR